MLGELVREPVPAAGVGDVAGMVPGAAPGALRLAAGVGHLRPLALPPLPPVASAATAEAVLDMNGRSQIQKLDFAERDNCKPVLLRLSLAHLVKPLISFYGIEWWELGYGINSKQLKDLFCFHVNKIEKLSSTKKTFGSVLIITTSIFLYYFTARL